MPNPKSCTHIKVTGVRCQSPALRGEQFCYFHQHAHRGVRRPAHSRLHPIALIESEEAIQASLMEVINGLIRNTLDVKRAELIIRALHIAVKNARHTRFDSNVYPKVREVPQYAEPESDNVETMDPVGTGAIARPASKASVAVTAPSDDFLPAVAAVPYRPVDPRDPHFLERFEEGGRVLARQTAERQADERRVAEARTAQAVARQPSVPPAEPAAATQAAVVVEGKVQVGTAAPARTASTETQRLPQPSRLSKAGNPEAERPATQAAGECESKRKDNCSSEGAKECSPARKRWVELPLSRHRGCPTLRAFRRVGIQERKELTCG